jgi:general secretion pathway protein D
MRYDRIFAFAAISAFIIAFAPLGAKAQQAPAQATRGSVRLPEAVTPAEEKGAPVAPTAEAAPAAKPAAPEAAAVPGGEEMVYLNVQDEDLKDVIRQISKATGKNFIIDDKVRGKVTIMSEKMMTKEEAYQAFLSALEVAGFTTVQGPGGIIKIVSLKDAASSPIPTHVDSTPFTDSFVTRLISLSNISALDMSNAIKGLISKDGNMFAYPATNTLIITDSGTNIDRLMKIIKELDQEGPQQVLEIIPINYADARDVAETVLNLFELEQAKGAAPTAAARRVKGAELEDIKDVSKIIADERTNSLIVLASKRAIEKVRDIIAKLDMPLEAADTGTIHVHYLKYANATELAQTLAAITSGVKAQATQQQAGGAQAAKAAAEPAVAQLEGGISIGADETTNALIITASAKDYKTIVDELISKLDIPRRQVYLEAVVMELEVFKRNQAGASGYGGGGGGSILGFGSTGFSDFSAMSGLFDPTGFFATPGLLGGLLSRESISIDVPSSGGGTTTLTIPSFAAFLNFLSTYRDANIVSTPNLMTLDNQKASIEVTRIQYANKTTQSGTTGFQTVEPYPLEAGLTLEITPQISEGDAVRLEIHHKLSNFTGDPGPTGAAPQTKREITTTVMAMDGQTVVLGGLMEDSTTHDKSKIPILGDIPLIGFLFKSTRSTSTKNNLLVFITPHVLRDPSDFAEISKNKIEQRNAFIEKNYGKRQQKDIYDTIAMHRADLLAFTPQRTYTPPASTEAAPTQGSRSRLLEQMLHLKAGRKPQSQSRLRSQARPRRARVTLIFRIE